MIFGLFQLMTSTKEKSQSLFGFFSLQPAQGLEGPPSSSSKRILFFISIFAFIVLQVVFCYASRLLLYILNHEVFEHQRYCHLQWKITAVGVF